MRFSFKAKFLFFFKLLPFLLVSSVKAHKPDITQDTSYLPNAIALISLETPNAPSHNDDIPFAALRTFVDVFDTIKQQYVEEVNNEALIENAIRGMLARLDPYSVYLNPEEFEEFERQTEGDFAGIGVVLDIRAGAVRVVSAIAGSPADKAGLKSGDIIIEVDGIHLADLTLIEAANLLEGEAGTMLNLVVKRDDHLSSYQILREIIHTPSIIAKRLDEAFAFARISQFQDDTASTLSQALSNLHATTPLQGLILDLRNNAGGLLYSAVETAELFLNNQAIVSIRGRDAQQVEHFSAKNQAILPNIPIILLVNGGTASAAEILVGALKDNHRAVVVGQPTFGKGSVQTVMPLHHGGAIKLTTASYYTPNGTAIHKNGINPDILLPTPSDNAETDQMLAQALNMLKAITALQHSPNHTQPKQSSEAEVTDTTTDK